MKYILLVIMIICYTFLSYNTGYKLGEIKGRTWALDTLNNILTSKEKDTTNVLSLGIESSDTMFFIINNKGKIKHKFSK